MGVHGLWELLAPVGHRVSNEHVHNKVLAVDISIWITQFVKAMRDAEGARVRNAHLLGVFRRCLKLLFLSVKPVFVFDGATPAIKRRTLTFRRAEREKHAAKLRRLAEKMLVVHIKKVVVGKAIAGQRKAINNPLKSPSSDPAASSDPATPARDDETEAKTADDAILIEEEDEIGPKYPTRNEKRSKKFGVSSTIETALHPSPVRDHVPLDAEVQSDFDQYEIALPENIADLDDEILIGLPPELQSKVFKQIKLEQRYRHREDMMRQRNNPAEFSRAQIAGFMRHTVLKNKISNVRKAINNSTGAANRIASNSRRQFILEDNEKASDVGNDMEFSDSEDDIASKSRVGPSKAAPNDVLSQIRVMKDREQNVLRDRGPRSENNAQRAKELTSGVSWASKVLSSRGSLYLTTSLHQGAKEDSSSHSSQEHKELNVGKAEMNEVVDLRPLGEPDRIPEVKEDIKRPKEKPDSDSEEDIEWEDGARKSDSEDSVDDIGFMTLATRKNQNQKIVGRELDLNSMPGSNGKDDIVPAPKPTAASVSNILGNVGEMKSPAIASTLHTRKKDVALQDVSASKSKELGNRNKLQVIQAEKNVSKFVSEGIEERTLALPTSFSTAHVADSLNGDVDFEESKSHPDINNGLCDFESMSVNLNRGKGREELEMKEKTSVDDLHKFAAREALRIEPEVMNTIQQSHSLGAIGLNSTQVHNSAHFDPCDMEEKNRTVEKSGPLRGSEQDERDMQTAISLSLREKNQNSLAIEESTGGSPEGIEPSKGKKNLMDANPQEAVCNGSGNECDSSRKDLDGQKSTEPSDSRPEIADIRIRKNQAHLQDVGTSGVDSSTRQKEVMSLEEMKGVHADLESEAQQIRREQVPHYNAVESISDEMYAEARDLLKLFGIPYLEAPMEAEAQCAFLSSAKVVDGVITEDSDAFLFGAEVVYRQLFAEGKFAEAYEAQDIKGSLGLDRKDLIYLAHLLGSDYTPGVRGVGIVNSMEIREAFPGVHGLLEFLQWMKKITILDKEPDKSVMNGKSQDAIRRRFCWKHRNVKRNWEIRDGFPSPAVTIAYLKPNVDESTDRFAWKNVDFDGLAEFCWEKFGWEDDRFQNAVGPLKKQLSERGGSHQTRIDDFFKPHRFAKIRSERLQEAVKGIAGDEAEELMATLLPKMRKRRSNPVIPKPPRYELNEDEEMLKLVEEVESKAKRRKRRR